ncbi:MAG: alpha/beta hydrolase [Flavobacterium sp.]|nr:alpha/beta hydrolase [Flavobacterium sp.]
MSSTKNRHLKVPAIIIYIGKTLQFLSIKWTTLYLSKLFTTPIKHKIPKREIQMDRNSFQTKMVVPEINKEIVVYQLGTGEKKIILVHGWSGRGTQLVKFADALVAKGYSIVSFDAPAHGKSPGSATIMTDFIASIAEVDRKFGPFDAAVGHSLGGMSLLNAIKLGLKINRLVTIGSGDKVKDILIDFVAKLELKPEFSSHLQKHFEKKYNTEMESYSAYLAAQSITIPVLVIHDDNDDEVPVAASKNIYLNLKNGELVLTKNLGHRKILGNHDVIDKTINFLIE